MDGDCSFRETSGFCGGVIFVNRTSTDYMAVSLSRIHTKLLSSTLKSQRVRTDWPAAARTAGHTLRMRVQGQSSVLSS